MKTMVVVATPTSQSGHREVRALMVHRGLAITPCLSHDGVVPRRYTITHLNTGGAIVPHREMTAAEAKRVLSAIAGLARWDRLTLTDMVRPIRGNTPFKRRVGDAIRKALGEPAPVESP